MENFEIQSPMAMANFIIKHAHEREIPISNLHLQKILYFLQAAFLVKYNGKPLINGNFSRWSYGPVMQEVYNAYRENGSSSIRDLSPNISIKDGKWDIKAPEITKLDEFDNASSTLLVNTIDTLLANNPWNLVDITHRQELWSSYEEAINQHHAPDYSNSEIYEYFKNNIGELIW